MWTVFFPPSRSSPALHIVLAKGGGGRLFSNSWERDSRIVSHYVCRGEGMKLPQEQISLSSRGHGPPKSVAWVLPLPYACLWKFYRYLHGNILGMQLPFLIWPNIPAGNTVVKYTKVVEWTATLRIIGIESLLKIKNSLPLGKLHSKETEEV